MHSNYVFAVQFDSALATDNLLPLLHAPDHLWIAPTCQLAKHLQEAAVLNAA